MTCPNPKLQGWLGLPCPPPSRGRDTRTAYHPISAKKVGIGGRHTPALSGVLPDAPRDGWVRRASGDETTAGLDQVWIRSLSIDYPNLIACTHPTLNPPDVHGVPEQFTMPHNNFYDLDEVFFEACLNAVSKPPRDQSPISTSSSLASSTDLESNKSDVSSARSRLTDPYPTAFTDFYGTPSGAPCIYKTGPVWPKAKNSLETHPHIREMRPVHDHPIMPFWVEFLKAAKAYLESCGIKFTVIAGFGMANAGEAKPFCPLVVNIGVLPDTVTFKDAKTVADHVKNTILSGIGFDDIDVAIREWTATLSSHGPKLKSLQPFLDPIAEFRHPITSTLSLSIAPVKTPYYEGTACLYFRLNKDSDDVFILTAAHVARPPPVFPDTRMSYKKSSQRRQEIVNLGGDAFDIAAFAIMSRIRTLHSIIESFQIRIERLLQTQAGGHNDPQFIASELKRAELEVEKTKTSIAALDQLHTDLTKHGSTLQQRTIGFVLHADPIGVGPDGHTIDWAAVQLYKDMFDWKDFTGNKVFIGGKIKEEEYGELMFPNLSDRVDYGYPRDGLLQVYGVVPESEIRQPKQLNRHGDNAMPVIKNGKTTGTTVGWINGLEALVHYTGNIELNALETTILPYGGRGAFSANGDSGSIVLDRQGRVVAMITGGGGTTDETDITFGTAYYVLEPRIKEALPGCFLYEVVNN